VDYNAIERLFDAKIYVGGGDAVRCMNEKNPQKSVRHQEKENRMDKKQAHRILLYH
jgi:hypothetical protein